MISEKVLAASSESANWFTRSSALETAKSRFEAATTGNGGGNESTAGFWKGLISASLDCSGVKDWSAQAPAAADDAL